MSLQWEAEIHPTWDADKDRVLGGASPRLFLRLRALPKGARLPGDWWRVTRAGQTVGFGWMDVTWGDAEVLAGVDPAARRAGVGAFIFDRLAEEAARRGVRYLYNVVPDAHPDRAGLTAWLGRQGFGTSGDATLRRPV